MPQLIELAKNKQHGTSRVLLLLGIRRSKSPEAKEAIEQLANDPELSKEIGSWRKKKRRR
jgi:hypothetical protein